MLFFRFCRDAGLHLGAGYRSDPAGGTCCFMSCLFHLHVLGYMMHVPGKLVMVHCQRCMLKWINE